MNDSETKKRRSQRGRTTGGERDDAQPEPSTKVLMTRYEQWVSKYGVKKAHKKLQWHWETVAVADAKKRASRWEGGTPGGGKAKKGAATKTRSSPKAKKCTQKATRVHSGGLCYMHRAKRKLCSHVGCTNKVIEGGVYCIQHFTKIFTCSIEGCTSEIAKGGFCLRHSKEREAFVSKMTCSREGCTCIAIKGGLCMNHGDYQISSGKLWEIHFEQLAQYKKERQDGDLTTLMEDLPSLGSWLQSKLSDTKSLGSIRSDRLKALGFS